jgi:uncharacterized protein YgiM (DUF1202 family)
MLTAAVAGCVTLGGCSASSASTSSAVTSSQEVLPAIISDSTAAVSTDTQESTGDSLPAIPESAPVTPDPQTDTSESGSSADTTSSTSSAASEAAQIDQTETDSGMPSGEGNTGTLNAGVNMRSSASAIDSSNVIGTIEKGETVTILGVEGDFYLVDYNGTTGYVSKQYID